MIVISIIGTLCLLIWKVCVITRDRYRCEIVRLNTVTVIETSCLIIEWRKLTIVEDCRIVLFIRTLYGRRWIYGCKKGHNCSGNWRRRGNGKEMGGDCREATGARRMTMRCGEEHTIVIIARSSFGAGLRYILA